MNSRFLNIHVLISHSPSCLNRDDMNMQKSAVFGGARRVRISSQSLKYAIRKSEYYSQHLGKPSIRTKNLDKITDLLVNELYPDFSSDEIKYAIKIFITASKSRENDAEDDGDGIENETDSATKPDKKLAITPWSIEEIREVCRIIRSVKSEELNEKEAEQVRKRIGTTIGKGKDKKTLTEEDCIEEIINKKIVKSLKEKSQSILHAMSQAKDIALSGRMTTSGLMTSVDGALAMAHAITTHEVDADIDWFTAVDDLLNREEEERGAAHLGTQEFSSGTFYRYASLNIEQLQKNLGGADREQALEIAGHLVYLLATVVPSAKQQVFAAHNLADLVLVSFGNIPVSGANAFEEPVKRKGGFIKPSIQAFENYIEKVRTGYNLQERHAAFCLWDTRLEPCLKSLDALRSWVQTDGKAF